jgi:hypothetical protein
METIQSDTPILDEMKGRFVESLKRNNKKIREDRAIQISEGAQMKYKRKVEDLQQEIKDLKRAREAALDMSPETGDSLRLALNFDPDKFVQDDMALGIRIREKEIQLEIAERRYKELFT